MTLRISNLDIEIGKKLREARTKAGISLQELGRRVGLTGWQISKYEHALDRIPAARLVMIAKALGIPPQDLLPDEN